MKEYDVFALGSALMDIIIEVDDSMLSSFSLKKGEMHLVDNNKSKEILDKIKHIPAKHYPGGSASNTASGVSLLGGASVFCGKVGNDAHGSKYSETIAKEGIKPNLHISREDSTGHVITFITPDRERTFATHLGASISLKKHDFNEEDLLKSKVLHIEAYQLELPALKELCFHAADIAKKNGILISIDLSDSALIKRKFDIIKSFVKNYADIVFANEAEAIAFTGKDNEEYALHELAKVCKIACVKLGEKGSLVKADGKVIRINAFKTKVVSSTGAGDMYAAAVLYGVTHNISLEKAAKLASYAAAKVVSLPEARISSSSAENIRKYLNS